MSWREIYFSDLHLNNALPHAKVVDAEAGVTDRLMDQISVLKRIFDAGLKHEVRAIRGLGDLFDKSRVDAITAAEGAPALWRLTEIAPLWLLPGNHECLRSQDGGRNFLEIIGKARTKARDVRYMEDGFQEARKEFAFWSLGFCNQKRAREKLEWMRKSLPKAEQNVLFLHHSIMGCQAEGGWVCDDGLGADEVLDGWEWAFSGHFHPTQTFGRGDRGMYLGSTMQLNFGDKGRACGFWLVEFDGKEITRNFIDSGAPRFFEFEATEDGVAIPGLDGVRPSDYLRRIFRGTSDDWRSGLSKKAERWKDGMAHAGFRASYVFKPTARARSARIFVPDEKSGKAPSEIDLVKQYALSEKVEVGSLSRERLRKFGVAIMREALSKHRSAAFADGSKTQIRSVRAIDFCAFADATLSLSKAGLVWVSGVNHDSDGAKSNGAAKTTLFNALSWGLFGETTEGGDKDEVIRLGEKEAKVVVKLSGGYRVVRTRRKASGKVMLEQKKGDSWNAVETENVQDSINRLLGMDFQIFRNTILYAQDDDQRFLRAKDRARKDLLYGLLGLEIYDFAFESCKVARQTYRKSADEQESELAALEAALAEIDITTLQAEFDDWELSRKEEVKRLKRDAREALELAASLAKATPESIDLRASRAKANSALLAYKLANERLWLIKRDERVAEEEISDKRVAAARLATALRLKSEALGGLDDAEKCPVCQSPLKKGESAKHILELKREKRAAAEEHRQAASEHEQAEVHFQAVRSERKLVERRYEVVENHYRSAFKALEEEERMDAELGRSEERAAEARKAAARAVESAKRCAEEENPIKKSLASAEKRCAALEAEIDGKKDAIASDRSIEAVYNFWCDGFGPQGLPSWLLDETMPEISRRANEYLESLADGDITLEFSTQRELKSSKAEFRDEIAVSWTIEGNANVKRSGGQKRKMELATDFALMDIAAERAGVAPKLMILDEALEGLDAEGCSRFVSLLVELRARRDSIFVVSHGAAMSELFEKEIVVEKRGKVSRIREATE
jgi:DNA repair exonuclease SbcCD ATPase subunit